MSGVEARWRKVDLVFTVFLDESGVRTTQRVASATALIIPAAQICRLEMEWKSLCDKEDFRCFHASPCNAQDKNSEFAVWGETKTDRVFERVGQICKKYGSIAISSAVNKRYYDDEIPPALKKYTGAYHYTWCVDYAIAYAEQWRKNSERSIPPFEFVFDWLDMGSPARKEIESVMLYSERRAREQGEAGAYERFSFRRKEEIPGLQCVDGIAWVCNCFARHVFHKRNLPARAKAAFDFWGGALRDKGWLHAFTFSRKSLREAVLNDRGRMLERYRRWEAEDREKRL